MFSENYSRIIKKKRVLETDKLEQILFFVEFNNSAPLSDFPLCIGVTPVRAENCTSFENNRARGINERYENLQRTGNAAGTDGGTSE